MKETFGYIQFFERLLPPEEGSLASLSYSPEKLVKQRAEVVKQIGLNHAQGKTLIRFAELYEDSKKEMDERYRQLHLQRPDPSARTDKDKAASLRIFADQLTNVNRLVIELREMLDDEGERLVAAYIDQAVPNIKFEDGGAR